MSEFGDTVIVISEKSLRKVLRRHSTSALAVEEKERFCIGNVSVEDIISEIMQVTSVSKWVKVTSFGYGPIVEPVRATVSKEDN